MDRGASQATVHRIAKSQTQLKRLSMYSGLTYKNHLSQQTTWKAHIQEIMAFNLILEYFLRELYPFFPFAQFEYWSSLILQLIRVNRNVWVGYHLLSEDSNYSIWKPSVIRPEWNSIWFPELKGRNGCRSRKGDNFWQTFEVFNLNFIFSVFTKTM